MNSKVQLLAFLLIVTGLISCKNKQEKNANRDLNQGQVTEKLLEANKKVIEFENEQIDKYISDSGWKMNKTGTGLRYMILEKGNGAKTAFDKVVVFEYEVKLISNQVIYSSQQTGPKEFKIGSGGVESGLEEGMLLLRVGDKATFIIPSYLAHGLSGDQDRIPPKATLIYTVKLIDLK
jgi:FKBP-type peptidyl-prolyl cis-trans isomerase FkpA